MCVLTVFCLWSEYRVFLKERMLSISIGVVWCKMVQVATVDSTTQIVFSLMKCPPNARSGSHLIVCRSIVGAIARC